MADNYTVINSCGQTITMKSIDIGGGVETIQSIPTSTAGTPLVLNPSSTPTSTMAAMLVAISPNGVNANGQATMANSAPVTIASNQSAVAVSLSSATVTLSSNPTVILSSNPTVIPSSAIQVTLTSNVVAVSSGTVTLSSNPTVIPSSALTVGSGNISLVPTTTGGLSLSSVIIASGTNSTLVSSSPRQIYKVECFNNTATIGYLHLYNLSSAPTAGSSLVFDRYLVPANTSGAGVISELVNGVSYATGIGYTFTGGIADSDTTAISSNASYIVNIYYK